jgi:MFS family permease
MARQPQPIAREPGTRATPPVETEGAGFGTFESLKIRNFRLLLIGTTLSNAGQWIQQVTLGWLVYDMTGSGTMLGTINLVRSFATVGLAPVTGVLIDRFARRTLMILINTWLLAISVALGLVLLMGHRELWYLFLFTFCGGVAQTLDMPLRQTVVFTLVPRALAPNALALVQTGWGLMRSLGPAVGGFLILWFGPGGNFLVQGIAYGLVALNILRIQFPPQQTFAVSRGPFLQNLKEGLRYVAHERVTRTFLVMGWILPLFIIPNFSALAPIYAKDAFEGGPEVLGLLTGSVGVGGILGGLVAASLGSVDRRGLVQVGAMLLLCASLVGFAFSPHLAPAMLFFGLAGFFELIFITGNQALLQLSIPDELRGRITSITSLSAGLMPLGALFAGVSADLIGPRSTTIILCGAAAAIAVSILAFVPLVRNYRLSRAIRTRAVAPGA